MFNGLRNFKNNSLLVEQLQTLGIGFGPHFNAYTSWFETVYMLGLPAIDENPHVVPLCFTVMRDFMDGALLLQEEIDLERGVILAEINQRDSVRDRLDTQTVEFLIPNTLYAQNGRYEIGGSNRTVIETIPRAEFVEFYQEYYAPSRMTFVVTGDIADVSDMEAMIKTAFQNMTNPENAGVDPDLGSIDTSTNENGEPDEQLRAKVLTDEEFQYHELYMYSIRSYNKYDKPDTKAERIKNLQLNIANRVLKERFTNLKLEDNSPISYGNSYSYTYEGEPTVIEFSLVTIDHLDGELEAGTRVLEQEFRRMMEYGITQSEFDQFARVIVNGYEESVEGKETRDSSSIADSLIGGIESLRVFSSPETNLEIIKEAIDTGFVTPESCHEIFREQWNNASISFVYNTKDVSASGTNDTEVLADIIKEYYTQSKWAKIEPPVDYSNITFGYTDFGAPGEIISDRTVEDLEIRQLVLSNNVRVNIKRTDFADNDIVMTANFGGGLLSLPNDPKSTGLDWFASTMINNGGLGKHSLDEIKRLTAGYSVGWTFSVEDDRFNFGGSTNPDDLLLELQLFIAHITDPGYRSEALKQWEFNVPPRMSDYKHTLTGPFAEMSHYLKGGDSRFDIPDEEVLLSFTPDDAKLWLLPEFATSYLEFSIVGDLPEDDDVLVDYILKTLGTLPQREEEPKLPNEFRDYDLKFPSDVLPQTNMYTYDSKLEQAAVVVGWEMVGHAEHNINITRSANILSSIFQDRMRVLIREELGAAYSTRALNSPMDGFDHGEFVTYAIVAPHNMTLVLDSMLTIAGNLASDGITEDELVRGKNPFLTFLDDSLTSNSYWLNTVLSLCQAQPYRLEWTRNRGAFYDRLKVEDIDMLAKILLQVNKSVSFKLLPADFVSQPGQVRGRDRKLNKGDLKLRRRRE